MNPQKEVGVEAMVSPLLLDNEEGGHDFSVCMSWFAMGKTSHLKTTQTVFKQLKKWSKVFVFNLDKQPS